MSYNQSQRGRFNGRGRGNDRGGGFQGQRDSGRFNNRYHNSQNRSSVPPRDDEDDFMFEIHPNRIDTVKFINAQSFVITWQLVMPTYQSCFHMA